MEKLKLNLEGLRIESFETTSKENALKGTVRGNETYEPCLTLYCEPTEGWQPTCLWYSCNATMCDCPPPTQAHTCQGRTCDGPFCP